MGAQEQKWGAQVGDYRSDFNRATIAGSRLDAVERGEVVRLHVL